EVPPAVLGDGIRDTRDEVAQRRRLVGRQGQVRRVGRRAADGVPGASRGDEVLRRHCLLPVRVVQEPLPLGLEVLLVLLLWVPAVVARKAAPLDSPEIRSLPIAKPASTGRAFVNVEGHPRGLRYRYQRLMMMSLAVVAPVSLSATPVLARRLIPV